MHFYLPSADKLTTTDAPDISTPGEGKLTHYYAIGGWETVDVSNFVQYFRAYFLADFAIDACT